MKRGTILGVFVLFGLGFLLNPMEMQGLNANTMDVQAEIDTNTQDAKEESKPVVLNVSGYDKLPFTVDTTLDPEVPSKDPGGQTTEPFEVYQLKESKYDNPYSIIFMGDGFTADEIESYLDDANADLQRLLSTKPFTQFVDYIDAYAIAVVSEHSGKHSDANVTYFHVKNITAIDGPRKRKLVALRDSLSSQLGISADSILQTALISNQNNGSGMSSSSGKYVVLGKGGSATFAHETSHNAGGMADEYWAGDINSITRANRESIDNIAKDGLSAEQLADLNMSDYDLIDVHKVSWNSYLGFRNVYVDAFDARDISKVVESEKRFRPNHKDCIMGNANLNYFCPMCEAELFKMLNAHFGYPYAHYIPVPEFSYPLVDQPTYYCNSQSKHSTTYPELPTTLHSPEFQRYDTLESIAYEDIKHHDLTYRSVINMYQEASQFTIRVIVSDNARIVLKKKEETMNIEPHQSDAYASASAKSLAVTITKKDWQDLEAEFDDLSTLSIYGEIVDEKGTVLASSGSNPEEEAITIHVEAYYGNHKTLTDTKLPVATLENQQVKLKEIETALLPIELEGYTYVENNLDAQLCEQIRKGQADTVKFYYYKNNGEVTLRAQSLDNTLLKETKIPIAYQETYTPKASDFTFDDKKLTTLPSAYRFDGLREYDTILYTFESKDSEDNEDQEDTSKPEPEKPNEHILKDEATGVELLSSSLGQDVQLSIKTMNLKDITIKEEALPPEASLLLCLDIQLLKDHMAIQPDARVKIRIPYKEEYSSYEKIRIAYIDDAGAITFIPCTTDSSYITFETDHFSYYAVVGNKGIVDEKPIIDEFKPTIDEEKPEMNENKPAIDSTSQTDSSSQLINKQESNSVNTQDSTSVAYWLYLIVITGYVLIKLQPKLKEK